MVDSLGIPGWDKVDHLATALLDLKGMCVSASQAAVIKKLYADLTEFDRRPLVFKPRKANTASRPGRFGKRRFYQSGHTSVDMVRR